MMMAQVIRIDDDVWHWLKSKAEPLEDTPNSVLRRLAGLDASSRKTSSEKREGQNRRIHGAEIDRERGLGSSHALYSRDGNWYDYLRRFPAAYHDADGFIIFESKDAYEACPYFNFGKTVNVNIPEGISGIPGYQRAE